MTDFDFDDWVEHGAVNTADATINNRHDAVYYSHIAELTADLEAAEALLAEVEGGAVDSPALDDDSLQSVSTFDEADLAAAKERVSGVEAEIEAFEASYREHDITVTVRALDDDTIQDIALAHMPPARLKSLDNGATDEQISAWRDRMLDWYKAERTANRERDIHLIAEATVRVVSKSSVANSISVDSLRKMALRPHGITLIAPLVNAVNVATRGEVEASRPKSQGLSTNDN